MDVATIEENFKRCTVFCDLLIQQLQKDQKLTDDDARVTYFRKISQISDTTQLSFSFYQDYLLTHTWWKDKFPNFIISNKNKQKMCAGYDQYVRTAFMIENFSAFESSIRVIAQEYNSKEYSKKQKSFNQIITWFLKELDLEETYPIIRVFSHVRNSMHSNGLFNPINQKDDPITYQNKVFSFKVGHEIEYGGWKDLLSITKIVVSTFERIVKNQKISKRTYIKEPSSEFWQ